LPPFKAPRQPKATATGFFFAFSLRSHFLRITDVCTATPNLQCRDVWQASSLWHGSPDFRCRKKSPDHLNRSEVMRVFTIGGPTLFQLITYPVFWKDSPIRNMGKPCQQHWVFLATIPMETNFKANNSKLV
jgi:hypothetical protein